MWKLSFFAYKQGLEMSPSPILLQTLKLHNYDFSYFLDQLCLDNHRKVTYCLVTAKESRGK